MQKEKRHTGRTNKDCSERRQAAKEKKPIESLEIITEPNSGLWR